MAKIYFRMLDLLDRRERRRFHLLFVMVLIMGLLEMTGVASIMPFLAVLSDPSIIEENAYLSAIYAATGLESERAFLTFLGAVVFAMMLVSLSFRALTSYALARFGRMRGATLSHRLMVGYLGQDYGWFLQRHSADLGKSLLSEVERVVNGAMLPFMRMVTASAQILFLVLLIILVDPIAALTMAGLTGGFYALVFLVLRRRLTAMGKASVAMNSERFVIASETMGGIKDVKVLGLEASYAARFRSVAMRLADLQARAHLMGDLPRYILEGMLFGGLLVLVLVLMADPANGLSDVVVVVGVYALAGSRLYPAVQGFYNSLAGLRFAGPVLKSVHADLIETQRSAALLPPEAHEPLPLRRELSLQRVSYAYPNGKATALDGLDMTIRARSTVGIVGGTGAGKTTAVDVMLGLLTPQDGRMCVDGVTIDASNRRAWRRSVGYVPQTIFLSDDSVASNIAFGLPAGEVDQARVEAVARIAELHDFVTSEMPRGYETPVGERGVRLSGGQRQRIGIARALYHDPDVLIMDEATSALDNLTERAVMDAVRNLSGAKTVIMIAHRLSTVRHCDVIFLMEKGRVKAQGGYDELMADSTAFRALAEAGGASAATSGS